MVNEVDDLAPFAQKIAAILKGKYYQQEGKVFGKKGRGSYKKKKAPKGPDGLNHPPPVIWITLMITNNSTNVKSFQEMSGTFENKCL